MAWANLAKLLNSMITQSTTFWADTQQGLESSATQGVNLGLESMVINTPGKIP